MFWTTFLDLAIAVFAVSTTPAAVAAVSSSFRSSSRGVLLGLYFITDISRGCFHYRTAEAFQDGKICEPGKWWRLVAQSGCHDR